MAASRATPRRRTTARRPDEFRISEGEKVHPEFSAAITRGRVYADANVAERLYQRAMGYSHQAVKIFMPAGAENPVYAEYTEHYPPDTLAATRWLNNRQPRKWRDKTEHQLTGAGGAPLSQVIIYIPDNGRDPELVEKLNGGSQSRIEHSRNPASRSSDNEG